jgi:pyruvate decarboxylase
VEIGCTDVFSVPGDFNLILLDHLLAEPGLNNIGCCNEINAGYAADGYARWKGVGAVVVTFTVGGLSVINSIAGAYSENLPLICIVGGPNSNDFGSNRILHHTIGIPDFSQEFRCFQTVTCYQAMSFLFQNPLFILQVTTSDPLRCQCPCFFLLTRDLLKSS